MGNALIILNEHVLVNESYKQIIKTNTASKQTSTIYNREDVP